MRKVVDIASIIALNSLSTTIWKMALFSLAALFICETNLLDLFLSVSLFCVFSRSVIYDDNYKPL